MKALHAWALTLISSLLFSSVCADPPEQFIIHNHTHERVNTKVWGTTYGFPANADSDKRVNWNAVKFLCSQKSPCEADIVINPRTADEIFVGHGQLSLDTGEITPAFIQGNGYNISVTGVGEITIDYTP